MFNKPYTKEFITQSGMENGYRILPQGMDQSVTPSNNPATSFDADKALFETFTKRNKKKRTPKDTLAIPVDSTNHHFINTK